MCVNRDNYKLKYVVCTETVAIDQRLQYMRTMENRIILFSLAFHVRCQLQTANQRTRSMQ